MVVRHVLIAFFLILSLSSQAFAHKVVASAYADGKDIEGEIGFSNGDMAKNIVVEVLDLDRNKIGETKTDEDGVFRFTPTQRIVHLFRANLGQGHVAYYQMEVDELPEISALAASSAKQVDSPQVKTEPEAIAPSAVAALSDEQVRAAVKAELTAYKSELAAALRKEVKPLRKEIAAYKEKNDLQSILGGIGYILGLFGIGFYVMARRERSQGSASNGKESVSE